MNLRKKNNNVLVWVCSWFAIIGLSFGQDIPDDKIMETINRLKLKKSLYSEIETDKTAIPDVLGEIDIKEITADESIAIMEAVLDKNLDETQYYVGPGDEFIVNVWGNTEKNYKLIADNEGNIFIPFSGLININGKTLVEAKRMIKDKMFEIFRNPKSVIITLGNIRQFKSYVIGEVNNPGGYLVTGMTRVSDIIKMAGGISLDGKKRGIEIYNDLYETRYADLVSFYYSEKVDGNPYIRQGDRILIPPKKDIITINGFVNHPDTFDVCDGDNIQDIIEAAGGFSRGADTAKILIHRFFNNYDSLITFEVNNLVIDTFKLTKDDRIFVCGIPDYREHLEIVISGEVKYPGVYPIRKDKTRLLDVLMMAGGLTEEAFLKGSKIIRKYYPVVGNREFERVKTMPSESLTPLERSYLKTRLVEEDGIVSIDFEELIGNEVDIYNIILRNKDEIIVMRRSLSIKVSGAVISPGLVGYKENADYKYYIQQTGGFNTRARKGSVMIIKGGTEVMLKPQRIKKLEAGDAIWVPDKEYKNKFNLTRDMLLIVGSLATLVISAFTIQQLVK